MLTQLHAARATNNYERQLAKLAKIDLLIIDDFGLKPLKGHQDEDFHDVISEHYERKSTIITSTLDVPEWTEAFPNRILGQRPLTESGMVLTKSSSKEKRVIGWPSQIPIKRNLHPKEQNINPKNDVK